MLSYWAYILIGRDNTGKTSFQKYLVHKLCNREYKDRLPSNLVTEITHPRMPRGIETLSTMNRSYQERIRDYGEVSNFFNEHFQDADICVLSSHTNNPAPDHLKQMIGELKLRRYNVAAVFFSNTYDKDTAKISLLDWDERLWIDNPHTEQESDIQIQIARKAEEFAYLLIARASVL